MRRFTWVLTWESDGERHELHGAVVLAIVGLAIVGAAGILIWRWFS